MDERKLYTKLLGSLVLLGILTFILMEADFGRWSAFVQVLESIIIISFWAVFYLLIKFTLFKAYRKKHKTEIPRIFVTMIRLLVILFAVLTIMVVVLDQSLMSLATLGGLVGAGVTFAVGELILDTFSGVILEIEGPLEINDWVQIEGDRVGQIISINWRTVLLKTVDDTYITVPHRDFTKGYINFSQGGTPYWDSLKFVMEHNLPVERAERILAAGGMRAKSICDQQCTVSAMEIEPAGIRYDVSYLVPNRGVAAEVRHDVIQSITSHLHECGLSVSDNSKHYIVSQGERSFKQREPISVQTLIRKVSFLKNTDPVAVVKISERAVPHVFSAGEPIVKEGDAGQSMFLIAEGLVSIEISYVNELGESKQKKLFDLGYGDNFGEMSLFLNDPRSATVRAMSNCLVYEISHDLVKESLEEHPDDFKNLVQEAKEKKKRNAALKKKMAAIHEEREEGHKSVFAQLKDLFS